MAKDKFQWIPPGTIIDVVATKENENPVVKEMTYQEWLNFKAPNTDWKYTAYQKGAHSYSYIIKKQK